MGAIHSPTRRAQGAHAEMPFNALVYNIKRMVSLIDIHRLLAAIPG